MILEVLYESTIVLTNEYYSSFSEMKLTFWNNNKKCSKVIVPLPISGQVGPVDAALWGEARNRHSKVKPTKQRPSCYALRGRVGSFVFLFFLI